MPKFTSRIRRSRKPRTAIGKYERTKRKYYRRRATATVSLMGQPRTKLVKMRYHTTHGFNEGVGATGLVVYRANSIYDPDYTNTGGQPRGRDEWANFYQEYTVVGAKITATFCSVGTAQHPIIGIALRPDLVANEGGKSYIENGRCIWKQMGPRESNKGVQTVTMKVNPRKLMGKKTFDDDSLGATFSTNPLSQCYFHVFHFHGDSANDVEACYATITIDYIVRLENPKTLSAS